MLIVMVACTGPDPIDTDVAPPAAPAWVAAPTLGDCPGDLPAPMLDDALAAVPFDRAEVGWSTSEYSKSSYADVLDDAFLMSEFRGLQQAPLTIPCFGATQAAWLDAGVADGRPATALLQRGVAALDVAWPVAPIDPAGVTDGLDVLLEATGDGNVDFDASAVPPGLLDALGPVFVGLAEVIDAWDTVAESAPARPGDLSRAGSGGVVLDLRTNPLVLADPDVQAWILSDEGPRALYGPALRLVEAAEATDLSAFAGQGGEGLLLHLPTSMGAIVITGPGADDLGEDFGDDVAEVLLHVDLGGDDTWRHSAGANGDGMPVSVMIDLDGADRYGYVEKPSSYDGDRLVSDAGGRYRGDANYGPLSLSNIGRQGSGRFGVGLLLDRGGDNDQYRSLRMSQGWAHLGVGLLVDDGGDDDYAGENGVQGGAAVGIAGLVDLGGTDRYATYTNSQGFAYVQAFAALVDEGDGDDTYWGDPGDPAHGGDPMYYSPQMPGTGQSSFVQGAGFGRRGDADGGFLSGGIGVLRDGGGDDVYTAGVFAQGVGYWQAVGVLADAGGNDTYDAFWYIQGGAAHYSVGALLDGGGDDHYDATFDSRNMALGAGHDFSVGVLVDDGGADSYRSTSLAMGASNCQGIGLFADNDGADTYDARSPYGYGLGNESSECTNGLRSLVNSIGLFFDSGGDADAYTWPDASRAPGDDASFGLAWNGLETEIGVAVDGDGETGMHTRR